MVESKISLRDGGKRAAWSMPSGAGAALLLAALACVPLVASWLGEPFYIRLFMRMMIFAIMALSLNLILGYGGLVCFGQAMFVGVAAYVVAILGHHAYEGSELMLGPFGIGGTLNAWISWPAALLLTTCLAGVFGTIALRTSGMYFIMITLALAQMLYFLAVSLEEYGGVDGLQLLDTPQLGFIDLSNRTSLYYLVFCALALVLLLMRCIVRSRFGLVLKAASQNDLRLAAVGVPVFWYRLAAFMISGAIAGLAGVLLVTSQHYVSPADMSWIRSGELIIMVVLGGMGTLLGPVLGAMFYLLAEFILGGVTEYWQMIMGPLLIVIVLHVRGGIAGLLRGGAILGRSRP